MLNDRGHPQPISIADIYAYAMLYVLEAPEQQTMMSWILEMDRIYLEHQYSKIESESRRRSTRGARRK